MNERIKQLWEESTGATIPAEGYYSSASSYNIEKFADLIVRECALMTRNLSAHGELAEKAVKEHFGVEE